MNDPMNELILLAVAMLVSGCIAGLFAGLLGVGGGIVIVPMMEVALSIVGVDPAIRMHIAVATSLAIIIPTSIASSLAHHRKKAVDIELVKRWALFVLLGALLGTFVAAQVHSRVLAAIFALFAFLIGVKMIVHQQDKPLRADVPATAWVNVIPASIGLFSSMMGIGGGTFSVMVMTLFGKPIHNAVGTASLFGLLIAVPGTAGFIIAGWGNPGLPPLSIGFVSLVGFVLIAPATVVIAPIGARIAHGMSRHQLNLVFGLFLLVASVRMFTRAI
jgi:uncharacterized membrane protein YfcA